MGERSGAWPLEEGLESESCLCSDGLCEADDRLVTDYRRLRAELAAAVARAEEAERDRDDCEAAGADETASRLNMERAIEDLMARAALLEGLLREVEWKGDTEADRCPLCERSKYDGHAPACRYAAALSAAGGGEG